MLDDELESKTHLKRNKMKANHYYYYYTIFAHCLNENEFHRISFKCCDSKFMQSHSILFINIKSIRLAVYIFVTM